MDYLISIVSWILLINVATALTDVERQSSGNSNNYDKSENYDTLNRFRNGDTGNSNYLSATTGGYYPRSVYDNYNNNYNKLNEPNSFAGNSDQYNGPSNFYSPAVLATPQYNPYLSPQRYNPLSGAPGSVGFMANSPNTLALLQSAVSPYLGPINYGLLASAPIDNQNYGYNGLYSSPSVYPYGSGGRIGIGDTPTSAAPGIANYGNFIANPLANPFYGLNIGGLGLINRHSLSSDSYSSHNNFVNPNVAYGANSYSPQQNSQQISNYPSNGNQNPYANLNKGFGNGFAASPLHPQQTLGSTGQQSGYGSNSFGSSYGNSGLSDNNNNYNTDRSYVQSASKKNEKVTSHSNVKSDDRWM